MNFGQVPKSWPVGTSTSSWRKRMSPVLGKAKRLFSFLRSHLTQLLLKVVDERIYSFWECVFLSLTFRFCYLLQNKHYIVMRV